MRVKITCEHEATERAPEGTFVWRDGIRIREKGLILEGPDVCKLVSVGLAEPADEECCKLFTPSQVALAKATGHEYYMGKLMEARAEAIAAEGVQDLYDQDEDASSDESEG